MVGETSSSSRPVNPWCKSIISSDCNRRSRRFLRAISHLARPLHEAGVVQNTPSSPGSMPTSALVRELLSNGSLLMKRQLSLARIEVRRDVKKERKSLELLGTAAALGYAALILFFVAA